MLKIAEYSSAAKALKEKTLRALDEAGIEYELPQRQSDKIKLVFAGQYSAGKSTIIKMLTGNESIATGAEITTQEAHSYDWNGLEITDTPGVHTTLRPDHDEISYEAIASADMLVFVVTNELFDSYIATRRIELSVWVPPRDNHSDRMTPRSFSTSSGAIVSPPAQSPRMVSVESTIKGSVQGSCNL